MLKVIIADDEIHICSLLKHLIRWEELGLELIGVYNDGESLLEEFDNDPADLLLCDIEMGAISGLEAIRQIREKHPDCQCVVISGYRNFDYAQTAIQYGVSNYLLKPIDENDLNNTLQNIVNKLNDNKETNDVLADYSSRAKLYAYINRIDDNTTIKVINDDFHYHFHEGMFIVVHAIFTRLDFHTVTLPRIAAVFAEELKRRMQDHYYELECFDASPNSITTIINYDGNKEGSDQAFIDGVLRDICIRIDSMFSCHTYFGISSREDTITRLAKQNDEATTVLVNRFEAEDIRCFYAEDKEAVYVPATLSGKEENAYINEIQKADPEAVVRWIREFFRSKDPEIKKKPQVATTYYFILIDRANDTIFELSEEKENKDIIRKKGIVNYENSRNVNDLVDSLCNFISELMETSLSGKKNNINIYVQQTKEYLQTHYNEKISLEQVAEQLKISPTYLSAIFKKETGTGFNQYLINVRIEEAKKLLRSSKYNLNEVANAVGYNDAAYFSVLFKKETRISPGEFRRLHQLKIGE